MPRVRANGMGVLTAAAAAVGAWLLGTQPRSADEAALLLGTPTRLEALTRDPSRSPL